MSQQVLVFEENAPLSFDDFAKQNGITYWLASDLAMMLGYADMKAIGKAINKAIGVCIGIEVSVQDNFIQQPSKNHTNDFKLTRFACYLTVMNGDISNSAIAKAQGYFARLADEIETVYQDPSAVDRVYLRHEISDREKTLSQTAQRHGVVDFGLFRNAGYRGMYNMNLLELKNRKGLTNQKDTLLDYMNPVELAGNIFRITQTDAKIKNQNIMGQSNLEQAAESVGRSVRNVMIENTGTAPENIKLDREKINKVKSSIKKTKRALDKHDKNR